jgi:glutamate/tyrosine decarboxylase-like PLP-dependent enzyme
MSPTPALVSLDPPQPLYPAPIHEYTQHLSALRRALLASAAPEHGLPEADTEAHLHSIAAAIPRATEPTYFGFVTGGVTPAAQGADELVSRLDANVAVHLPDVSVATVVEDTALRWLLQMLGFDPAAWPLRTCSTGATASNVLGLACGRDWVVREAARRHRRDGQGGEEAGGSVSVAHDGLPEALRRVGARGIRVLSPMPHSSLRKAASIVGLGHAAVVDIGHPLLPAWLDVVRLRALLADRSFLNIVVLSVGEVNTGFFSTTAGSLLEIRQLCNQYGA